MTDITIPPEAIEAAARACYEYWREKDTTKTLPPWESERFIPFREGWRDQATAACRAMLKAWPGMHTRPNIYGRQDAILVLPLTENSDE